MLFARVLRWGCKNGFVVVWLSDDWFITDVEIGFENEEVWVMVS